MEVNSRATLPDGVGAEFALYVNGVEQQRGVDYRVDGRELLFPRTLAEEGKLGFWRTLSLLLGIAGTYRRNDTVDVVYDAGGRRVVAQLQPEPFVAPASVPAPDPP